MQVRFGEKKNKNVQDMNLHALGSPGPSDHLLLADDVEPWRSCKLGRWPDASCRRRESSLFSLSSVAGSASSTLGSVEIAGRAAADSCSSAANVDDIEARRELACISNAAHFLSRIASRSAAVFCCSVYSWEQSSNSWGLISMNSFIAL